MTDGTDRRTISIVVRALDEVEHLPALFSGLLRQTLQPDQVVLVDSGSNDDTMAIAEAHGAEIVHIRPDDFSFGRSLNVGCDAAAGDVLVFVSAHVYPPDEHWLANLVAPFAWFVRAGWDVWAFEPSTVMYDALIERFGLWRNLQVFPVAVSDAVADEVSFVVSDRSTGISSLLDFHDSHRLSETVATRRLDALPLDELNFLKIDTEGFDRDVFRSRGSPVARVIVNEFDDNKTLAPGYSSGSYADQLRDAGYHVWVSEWDPIVRYGGDHSWRSLDRSTGIAPDSAAWGNDIAVHESVEVDVDDVDDRLVASIDRQTGSGSIPIERP